MNNKDEAAVKRSGRKGLRADGPLNAKVETNYIFMNRRSHLYNPILLISIVNLVYYLCK
jgi:hypothetical protein